VSDFLSSLAARSLGLAEVVRPRVASLFEPRGVAAASHARSLRGFFEDEDGVPGARSTVAVETTRSREPAPAFPPRHDERGDEKVDSIEPVASERTERATEEERAARTLALTVAPAMRAHAPTRLPPTFVPRPSDGDAIRRTPESTLETYPAQLPDGTRRTEHSSARAESESHRPANEYEGASRDLERAAGSRRPAVEHDGARHAAIAVEASARQTRELLSVPPALVARSSQTDATGRSGQDALAPHRARVPCESDAGAVAPSIGKLESVRPEIEDRRGALELRSSELSGGERVTAPDPVTAISARVVAQPRVGLYAEPAAPRRPRPAIQPEPTIQVTIGRVEVRATQSAAPARPRERHTPSAMSLEEYLRRRAEGNAR
jgi:hypothetical protein